MALVRSKLRTGSDDVPGFVEPVLEGVPPEDDALGACSTAESDEGRGGLVVEWISVSAPAVLVPAVAVVAVVVVVLPGEVTW
jgi:hypothetical protein